MHHEFVILNIVLIFAVSALVISFAFDNSSAMAVQRLSIHRCSLLDGFEKSFASKNDCVKSLQGLCAQQCAGDIGDCIDIGKRSCSDVGRFVVG